MEDLAYPHLPTYHNPRLGWVQHLCELKFR